MKQERIDSMEVQVIELRDFFKILSKRKWLIMLITLLFTLLSAYITYYVLTPVYQAETELLVNKDNHDDPLKAITTSDIDTNIRLISTYSIIIRSPRIMDIVGERLEGDYLTEEIQQRLHVQSLTDSQVMSIIVEDTNQQKAVEIANTIANTFQEEIVKIMKVDNVQILTPARVDQQALPIKPKPILNISAALMLGLAISIISILLYEFLSSSIKSEEEIRKLLGLNILGSVNEIKVQPHIDKMNYLGRSDRKDEK